MNPMKLLQLKSAWERFRSNHPKFPRFLTAVYQQSIRQGTVIEFHVTTPEGETLSSNIRLKADDIALFRELQDLMK